jgi:hypothetical protein
MLLIIENPNFIIVFEIIIIAVISAESIAQKLYFSHYIFVDICDMKILPFQTTVILIMIQKLYRLSFSFIDILLFSFEIE